MLVWPVLVFKIQARRLAVGVAVITNPTQRPATAQKVAKHTALLQSAINASGANRLIDFREVNRLTGSTCKTGHTARALARRGQILAVRLNERVIRYRLDSVLALVRGEVDAVAAGRSAATGENGGELE